MKGAEAKSQATMKTSSYITQPVWWDAFNYSEVRQMPTGLGFVEVAPGQDYGIDMYRPKLFE